MTDYSLFIAIVLYCIV